MLHEKICTIDRIDAEAWFMLGAVHQQQDRLDNSLGCYACAAELTSVYPKIPDYLELVSTSLGRTQEAIDRYRWMLALQPVSSRLAAISEVSLNSSDDTLQPNATGRHCPGTHVNIIPKINHSNLYSRHDQYS